MSFQVDPETLEALEWTRVVELLRGHCRTGLAREWLDENAVRVEEEDSRASGTRGFPSDPPPLFETSLAGVRRRLAETDEARALIDQEILPPLTSTRDLRESLVRAAKGGILETSQFLDVAATLRTLREMASFLANHAERAPQLAELGEGIEINRELENEIEFSIDDSGEVRDRASAELAESRRDSIRLSGELQKRLERLLHDPEISPHLSDHYYTLRHDRYVLPVKAGSRGRVRGIVHDASRSGTTLFIEPETSVELNNRLRETELVCEREVLRVLRKLSQRVSGASEGLQIGLSSLARLDLAFARGLLSETMQAHSPRVEESGVFRLPALRHPLIEAAECVANDLELGEDFQVLVLSGPNAGGKTVAMKAVALAALFARAGLHIPCEEGARVDLVESVIAEIGDHQDIAESLSTFSAHMANLSRIITRAGRHSLVVLDEIGVGTDPGEGAALAQSILEELASRGALVITTTHYNLLKEMANTDSRFQNASVEFDSVSLAATYRIKLGLPGASSASAVAARMGMPGKILARANALLEREDRQLEKLLSELATSRAALAREQQEATRMRSLGEAARDEYRGKLERLQARRDKLFRAMREDLDRAFKHAHGEVANVIRDLQRDPSSRKAAHAREQLMELKEASKKAQGDAGIPTPPTRAPDLRAVDWRRIQPGDPIQLASGNPGVLESLPDRRGRVGVRIGGKKLILPAESVGLGAASGGAKTETRKTERVRVERVSEEAGSEAWSGGVATCDLRGQRVDEALGELSQALDRATSNAREGIRIIHGIGSGALRRAVRQFLRESSYVENFRPGSPDEGGEGVTLADFD